MKAYKGFNPDMTCRGFQYKEGETYETDKARLCSSGFHACERPIDVICYYPPSQGVYHEVEVDEVADERDTDDSKIAAKKIKIGARLSTDDLINAQTKFVKDHCASVTAGDKSVAVIDIGAATAGEYSVAAANNSSVATVDICGVAATRDHSIAAADDYGVVAAWDNSIAVTGELGVAATRDHSIATAGFNGIATAGRYGVATAGNYGIATSKAKSSVGMYGLAIAKGHGCKVRGGLGSILVLIEDGWYGNAIHNYISVVVDGETIKADTWYHFKYNEFVECEDED